MATHKDDRPKKSKKKKIASQVEKVGDQVKAKTGDVVSEAKTAAMDKAETGKDSVSSYVECVATAVHRSADTLREQGRGRSADYVENAADSVSTLAERLSSKSTSDLLAEAEEFARQRPAIVFGAAVVAGLGLVRFLRSTDPAASSSASTRRSTPSDSQAGRSGAA